MEKIVRAVNQLGMVVRGLFGEGSDASGSIFQISNQTTLGESEDAIIKRLGSVLSSIVEHELNARQKLLEADGAKLFDKIGRAYGILRNSHLLSSSEAMNLLSLVRLGIDLDIFPESNRTTVDRLFIEAQPGHLQPATYELRIEIAVLQVQDLDRLAVRRGDRRGHGWSSSSNRPPGLQRARRRFVQDGPKDAQVLDRVEEIIEGDRLHHIRVRSQAVAADQVLFFS